MNIQLNKVSLLCVIFFCATGCAQENRELAPPSENQWVEINIKAPENTKAFPVTAYYTSELCKKERYNSDMKIIKITGILARDINMDVDSSSQQYHSKIPRNGGGVCQWKLSRVTFGIEYSTTDHLIVNGEIGGAVGIIVAFDDEGSRYKKYPLATTPLSLSPTYYPLISEWHITKKATDLSLFGKVSFDEYRMNVGDKENVKINFMPTVDESKVIKMIGPREKKKGNHWRIEYPDGTVTDTGEVEPDFDKVKAM